MSNHVVYNRLIRVYGPQVFNVTGNVWFVLKDKSGKVRDWVSATDGRCARRQFAFWRDTGKLPIGYRVERRGKVE